MREFVYRGMKNFKGSEFLDDLGRVPWDSAYAFDDVNNLWDHWGTVGLARSCKEKTPPKGRASLDNTTVRA